MKQMALALFFIVLVFSGCGGKSDTTDTSRAVTDNTAETQTEKSENIVKIGTFLLEPFLMEKGENNEPEGVTIDYWKQHIAPRMGVQLEISGPFPVLRLIAMLESGEVDVIPQLTKNAEREAKFLYPANPFSDIKTCLVVLNENPMKEVTKQEDLFDFTIGFFEGGTIPDFLKHDRIEMDLITQTDFRQTNLDKLVAKRINAMFDLNYTSMAYDIAKKGFKDKVRTVFLPLPAINVYSIFTKSERGERLLKLYEKANDALFKTSAFEDLTQKYME